MAADLNVGSARWLICALLIMAGPIAVAMVVLVVAHSHFAQMDADIVGPVGLMLAWGSGLLGVHRLPIGRMNRVVVATVYTPLAVAAILMTVLVFSCMWFHECV